jgi:putative ATPase
MDHTVALSSFYQSSSESQAQVIPLAEQLRPDDLQNLVGQTHLFGEGGLLSHWASPKTGDTLATPRLVSMILWGPPGIGKTTLAQLLAKASTTAFESLSAVSSGIKELREVVARATERLASSSPVATVLFIDEIHRYSKTQQDALLPHVERGTLILIGATTENPYFQVIPALRSRVLLVQLQALTQNELLEILRRAVVLTGVVFEPKAACVALLLRYSGGDARKMLTLLDAALRIVPSQEGGRVIPLPVLQNLAQHYGVAYDGAEGDQHYDHASAYQKSLRGSDPDAALYWLAKMITAGEDLRFIARRLLVTAAEDVGLADPQAFVLAQNAAQACELLGLPEARIPLSLATLYVAKAPKCPQAIMAIDAALHDIQYEGKSYPVPLHLRDAHYAGAKHLGHGVGYTYTHDAPEVPQCFMPEALRGKRYYTPPPKA